MELLGWNECICIWEGNELGGGVGQKQNAMAWMSLSLQNSFVEILTPKCYGIRRWGHESWTFMSGISAFRKETPQRSLTPSTTWGYNEKSATLKRALTQPYCHPDLRLSVFKIVRNKFLLFIRYPVCGIFI